jgi:hypothetical protein
MQYYGNTADFESWIETGKANFANGRRPHKWHDNPASITIELSGLHYDDERDRIFVLPGIPMNVKLGHQSDEYSSAIEPDLELNLFHVATVASTAFDCCNRSRCTLLTNSESNPSTTPERLSVIDLAWLTKSSFKVRLTGRFLAPASKLAFMLGLLYAHDMRIAIRRSSKEPGQLTNMIWCQSL